MSRTSRVLGPIIITVALAASAAIAVPAASAATPKCGVQVNNTYPKLLECVTVEGARDHQQALQQIADANGGTRVSGSPGYDQSVAYAEQVFEDAGLVVTRQAFQFQTFVSLSPAILGADLRRGPGDPSRTRS